MAAKNNDSKRIFDQYINRYLNEQQFMSRDEAEASVQRRQDSIKQAQATATQQAKDQQQAAQAAEANKPKTRAEAMTAAMGNKPRVAPMNQDELNRQEQAKTQQAAASSPIASGSYDPNLQTTKPAEPVPAGTAEKTGLGAVAQPSSGSTSSFVAAGDKASGNQAAANFTAVGDKSSSSPSEEEKAIFKKLHGSDYTPGVGDQRLAELRNAVKQAGGSSDINKIASAAYAQQYAGTPQGQAYTKKAESLGIKVPKPGEINTNYAQQAQQLGLSPETQQDLAASQSQTPSAPTAQNKTKSAEILNMAKQLGLSQQTIDALSKDPALSQS